VLTETIMRPRDQIKQAIEQALRREFPTDTVDVSDGYKDNIHVLVVSRRFDPMEERTQQELLWSLIDGAGLAEDEKNLISLVMPTSPSLLK
jgi:acid stress-induced BolA-like protein IbaG/YrbA